jgi:AraC family transcriptional regulator
MITYQISGGVLANVGRAPGPCKTPHGTVVRDVEYPAFRLTEVQYAPAERLGAHAHDCVTVTVVLTGSFKEQADSQTFVCRESSVLYKPALKVHENQYGGEGASCLVFALTPSFVDLLGDDLPDDQVVHVPGAAAEVLVRQIIREARTGDPVAWSLALKGLLLELLASVCRHAPLEYEPSGPGWLSSVLDILQERFRDPIRITDIADAVNVHPSHLARVFREHLGVGPSAYIRRLRARWAEQHVARSARSLAQIAREAGFADQSHFTRVFKEEIGITPARLRALKSLQ